MVTRAAFDADITVLGIKDTLSSYSYFEIGNFDLQNEAIIESEQEQYSAEAIKKMQEELKTSTVISLVDLNFFNTEQVKEIERFITVYVTEILAAKDVEKSDFFNKIKDKVSDKFEEKLLSQFGLSKSLIPNGEKLENTINVKGESIEGKEISVEIKLTINAYGSVDSKNSALVEVDWKVKDTGALPSNTNRSGKGAMTYVNWSNFANYILDYVNVSYSKLWGEDADKIVKMFESKPLDALLCGSFSNKVFTLSKKLAQGKTLEEIMKEEAVSVVEFEGKRIIKNGTNKMKMVSIKCPVDVYVYDRNENIVAAIINNRVDESYQGVYCNVIGDEKQVYLTGSDYSIKIIGNDEGTMEYSIQEYYEGEPVRTVITKDVPLKGGKEYNGFVPDVQYIDSYVYELVSDTDEVIKITDDSIKEENAVFGDTNGDGEVNIADALMISRYDAGLTTLDESMLDVSDVNGDGDVNIADALMIARLDAGLIESL